VYVFFSFFSFDATILVNKDVYNRRWGNALGDKSEVRERRSLVSYYTLITVGSYYSAAYTNWYLRRFTIAEITVAVCHNRTVNGRRSH